MRLKGAYVTGLGALSCLGSSVDALWDGLCAGQCGLGPITRFDLQGSPYTTSGEVKGFCPAPFEECGLSMAGQFAALAAEQALEGYPAELRRSLAVVLATNFGPAEVFERQLAGSAASAGELEYQMHVGMFAEEVQRVARRLGAGGPLVSLSLSCASGAAAIVHALELIRSGRAEAALACGYDSVQRISWAGLCALRVMALSAGGRPALVRPFDKDRSGTIFTEGAGCLLLESEDSVRRRQGRPLAVVAGGWANNNAYHMTHADKEGAGTAAALRMALADASVEPGQVDCLIAHGTGTPLNDAIEARAFRAVLGERAEQIPVTALKGALGHAMGAASSLEAIAAVLVLTRGLLPPTVNLLNPDPECRLDLVREAARPVNARVVLTSSAGIGGANAALVLCGLSDAPDRG